ncbi:DUF5009 domain-containing protein [Echinicola sp. CAU 1574]|uniref:DUF5009 domain-containing protein n=1 Tax=Echinicola arenosa TaxID=2774144 RepID=A0ABR9ASG2_9BACT|nr:DUF5009 domain-containing protein [Echinicola arenosa]MBD8491297.1 DUF5009 domain-containing protein [Echinicola arenosa]
MSSSTLISPNKIVDSSSKIPSVGRLYSIDVFRAITMLLMVFVNDLWSLEGYPEWLGHASADEDRLGMSDIVFPAFLLIVGLSIPYAIRNRLKKGDSKPQLAIHIMLRSLALLVMGIFHVNLESYSTSAPLSKPLWQILITIAFFLIWMDYPRTWTRVKRYLPQSIGVLMLLALAFLYEGGSLDSPTGMQTHWYGILGLIGWSYLICSMFFLLTNGKVGAQALAFLFFMAFNALEKLGYLDVLSPIRQYIWIVGNGSMPAFTMAGIVVSIYYHKWFSAGKPSQFWIMLSASAVVMLGYGLVTRPIWGIHKLGASPSWVALCIGISILAFGLLIWLVDIKEKKDWFRWIRPAGTSTLTCYLIPYIHYAIYTMIGISLPIFLRSGIFGIFKCLVYAFLVVLLTGVLEKYRIRLKI